MKKRILSAITLLSVLCMMISSTPVCAKTSDEIRQEIEELEKQEQQLQQQMDQLEQQLSENLNQIQQMVRQKSALDQQIALLNDQIANVNEQIRVYGQLVADQEDALREAQEHLDTLNEKYKDRIRAMEEAGKLSYWSVLFKASSFADFLDRLNMIREIAEADQRRLEELAAASERVAEAKAALEREKAALDEKRTELENAQAELEEKRLQADQVLQELMAKGAEFEALLEESEKLQDDLMNELAEKEDEYDRAKYEEWLKEHPPAPPAPDVPAPEIPDSPTDWITPVPYYTLTSPFGMRLHPILGVYRMHNGVDLACAEGTPIYASRGGLVEVAGYQEDGAGNYIQLNHGDGFRSIYMHMTNYIVKQGDYVAPGQIIGYVGNTGLSKGAHLHFGISYNGTYVNPMEYIG